MNQLHQLTLRGVKSTREQTLTLGNLNLLIGANGAGKGNVVSFFRMLNRMFAKPPALAAFVAQSGGASSLLFQGAERTPGFQAELRYRGQDPDLLNGYDFSLGFGAGDAVYFEQETIWLHNTVQAAGIIGLPDMEARCRHFREWMAALRGLGHRQP